MEFECLRPKITKEFLFSKGINQESIIVHYTGIDITSKRLFLSPFRSDKKVTCGLYKSKNGTLYIHDFATNEHINCFEVVMRLFNINYYQALEIIAQDFGLIKGHTPVKKSPIIVPEIKETESSRIQVQIKRFSEEELKWWESFGITLKLLKKYNVFSIQHVFLNGELKFSSSSKNPIYGYYFGHDKNGEEKWKIYFPMRQEFRFLNNISKKILQGYKQLPKTGDYLCITKSMKDCIALNRLGIAAVSPNSETLFIDDKKLQEFKQRFKHIIVLYDNDRPGKYNMAKIRREYPELNYYFLPNYLEKDVTDTIKRIGFEKMKELVNQFISNYKFK